MEERLDGSLAIRFREHYLKYTDLGVVPPKSRSLSRGSQLNGGVEDRVFAGHGPGRDADRRLLGRQFGRVRSFPKHNRRWTEGCLSSACDSAVAEELLGPTPTS